MTRRMLILVAGVLSVGVYATAQVQTKESQAGMTPAEALEKLKKGNQRFVSGERKPRDYNAKVIATAAGQHPFAAIVSCMDSRAPMEIILDQGIGDMFSLRTAGNVVDEDVLGGLEYAAKVVGVKLLVVLGHTGCGAVKGAIDDVHLGNLTQLLAKIRPAIALAAPGSFSSDKSFVKRVEEQNVRLGIKQIREHSTVLREMLDAGAIRVAGGMYDIETGKVVLLAD